MKIKNFTLKLSDGTETADGYVALSHGTIYSLILGNDGLDRADVDVSIDGHAVGTWRIKERSSITIERPVHDTGRFTFYNIESPEGQQSGLKRNDELGLVKAVFKPEYFILMSGRSNLGAGGTGLSGDSDQKFHNVSGLNTDPKDHVTIYLRLGVSRGIRPLAPSSNSIPPPL